MMVCLTFWRDHNSSFWRQRSLPPSAKLPWVCTAASPLTTPPFVPQDYLWAEVQKDGKKTRKNNNKDKQVFSHPLLVLGNLFSPQTREREREPLLGLSCPHRCHSPVSCCTEFRPLGPRGKKGPLLFIYLYAIHLTALAFSLQTKRNCLSQKMGFLHLE